MSGPPRSSPDSEIVAMYETREHSIRDIAKHVGRSSSRVHVILQRNNVKFNPPYARIKTAAAPTGRGES